MKKFLTIIFLILLSQFCTPVQAKMEAFVIKAQRNAVDHNNLGLIYMKDQLYYPAIKEFQMAILLDPETQASGAYYANLAHCYMEIGYPALAQEMLEKAVKRHPMQFTYYEQLVETYKRQGLLDMKQKYYEKDCETNPLSKITVGIIMIENGNKEGGIGKLYEFIHLEPDLLITPAVKKYIKSKNNNKF